ncbi:2Fe-2S iron-sulfur cluster-binding protein, partial [Desulfarculus baarsii]
MAEAIFNGRRASFQPGETILEAARRAGVEIPTLCHMKDFSTSGQCGVCVVELAGSGHIKQACRTPLEEGMVVATDSPKVREARANALRRLVASGAHNCLVCDIGGDKWQELQMEVMAQPWHDTVCPAWGDCRLQDLIIRYGVSMRGVEPKIRQHPLDDDQPMIVRDFSRCIKCGRCVSACNDVQVNLAIAPPDEAALKAGLLESDWRPVVDYAKCTHCGQCIQACPVGALFEKKAYGQALANELQKVRTTCPYCGVGCQIWLHVKDGRIVKTSAVEDAEPNKGRLCVKGR